MILQIQASLLVYLFVFGGGGGGHGGWFVCFETGCHFVALALEFGM